MTDIVLALFAFILMISVIVTVHEFGHYLAARSFGLIATDFSIGFGKGIVSRKDGLGTRWKFAPFLIGGYVKFPGDGKDEIQPGQKTLNSLPRWQRAIVVAAGPGINFVLAALIFIAIAYFYGYPAGRPLITAVVPGSPAAEAQFQPGDTITRIDGATIIMASDITQRVMLLPNQKVVIGYERNGIPSAKTVVLAAQEFDDGIGNVAKIGFLGVELPQAFERSPSFTDAIAKGVADGMFTTYAQLTALKQIITGEREILELSGPIRIAKMSGHTLSLGLLPFLYLTAMLSIGVGVINLLPIPALDGGHLATYAVEGILGRDLSTEFAERLVRIGLCVIVAMGVLGITLDLIALT